MHKIKNFLVTNRMFFSIAWKKHKSYYFLYIVSIFYRIANNMILVYLPKLSLDAFLEKNNFFLGVAYISGSILISIIWAYFERKIAVVQSLNVTDISLEMRNKLYKKIIDNNLLAYEDSDQYDALLKALNYTAEYRRITIRRITVLSYYSIDSEYGFNLNCDKNSFDFLY